MRRVAIAGAVAMALLGADAAAKPFHFKFDVAEFRQVAPQAGKPKPGIGPSVWVDTRIQRSGGLLIYGRARSHRPYHIHLSYTDSEFAYESVEITAIELTYDDGAVEPAIQALRLPLRFRLRRHEWRNSTADGIVTSKANVLAASLQGLVTRDRGFTLKLRGAFVAAESGKKTVFEINETFRFARRTEEVPMPEVWKEI